MKAYEFIIKSEEGLHARPAANFVNKSRSYKSEITVEKGGEIFNAKSITSVLSMGACKNDKIIIKAEGDDESHAIEELALFFYSIP
ncbi:HPr family phosphocarrier protein [Acerihabitans sp. TG2]|uniref:HPr family phosphocarrier protein n=1 Tax=Acerihabitans sp. TG2 TaxID=3096008 RepID=UPI002B22EBEF|nr:HPr family phosphocarrier protein [Acerihabitans sp. TG2]MEA9390272.1 HPr family phosphocarrier protein [Acerihabitans sp. TG2]